MNFTLNSLLFSHDSTHENSAKKIVNDVECDLKLKDTLAVVDAVTVEWVGEEPVK